MLVVGKDKREASNGNAFYVINFANGDKKTSQLVFLPDADRPYDPSRRSNIVMEQFFKTVFGLEVDPSTPDQYVQDICTGYDLIASHSLKGLHAKVRVGYSGIHAKYIKGDKPTFMLCTKNGEPMKGYESSKFDSRGAVEAEIENLNAGRPADKQFRFNKFPDIQEYLEPKESNTALLAKVLKSDKGVDDAGDEDTF